MAISKNNAPVPINADLILLINKMRAAWREKQFRSKHNGKKTYSFVMSVDVEKQLKTLAGSKGEIRQTLEQLINEQFRREMPIITELKKRIKKFKPKRQK